MKTKLISTIKKDLLIIELPKWYKSFNYQKPLLEVRGDEPNLAEFLSLGRYELLGKPYEIKEEDVKDLVGEGFNISVNKKVFNDYNDDCNCFKTALESFHSALESEIYWENPYGKEPIENLQSSTFGGEKTIIHRNQMNILWHEAESRTFDRNRTLIFVKN